MYVVPNNCSALESLMSKFDILQLQNMNNVQEKTIISVCKVVLKIKLHDLTVSEDRGMYLKYKKQFSNIRDCFE